MPRKVQTKIRRQKEPKRIGRARRIPDLKPGQYADGLPLDEVQYLECKIILRPNHFTSRKSFFDFAKIMRRAADEAGVELRIDGFADEPLQIREVLFLDTADFRLYNNAFILRRRIPYSEGFPIGARRSSSSFATRTCRRPRNWTCDQTSAATTGSSSRPRSCP